MNKKQTSRRADRMEPSPETIRRLSAAIREGWSDRERAKRAGLKQSAWTPPQILQDEWGRGNTPTEDGLAGRE